MKMLQVCAVDFTAYHMLGPLMRGSRRAGWDVEFACADGPFAEVLRKEGFVHRSVPMTRSPSPHRLITAAASLARQLRTGPPDLIHTHTPIGGVVGRAAALSWRGPVAHTFHGLPFAERPGSASQHAFLAIERVLMRRTQIFFSQARSDAQRAFAYGIARPADTVVIGNGVDVRRFRPDVTSRQEVRSALGLPDDAVVAITVARLVKEKGLLELADAAIALASITRLHVLVVGQALPSDRTSVTVELDRHPVAPALGSRWQRLGHRTDVDRLLQAADIFVLPTYREGLPRSVIEAMACGLAVVATDIPACRELVREGETGLLVPPRDAARLAEAIRLLAGAAELRTMMGQQAREIALEEHDEHKIVTTQLDRFRRLMP